MRLKRIEVNNFSPIQHFLADNLSDLVVIAGANGAGKTRLVSQVLQAFQNANQQNVKFTVEATNQGEVQSFGSREINSEDPQQRQRVQQLLQQRRPKVRSILTIAFRSSASPLS